MNMKKTSTALTVLFVSCIIAERAVAFWPLF